MSYLGRQARIGFSLPVTYLSGNITNKEDVLWSKIYYSSSDFLTALKENGVTSVEINKLKETTPLKHVRKSVEAVLKSGLGITVHGWLPAAMGGQLLSIIDEMESVYKAHGLNTAIPMAIHGHSQNPKMPVEQAIEETIDDLCMLTGTLNAKQSMFLPVLEICRHKKNGPAGNTFEEVLRIADQVGYNHLGICWDMGHTQSNYKKQTDEPFPSQEFLKKVKHTHIHDILPSGQTHGPIVHAQGYVRQCVDLLKGVEYSGVYNMEFYPIRWGGTPEECRNLVVNSIRTLTSMVDD
jgi:sugar phosphate isomerase/epimerase